MCHEVRTTLIARSVAAGEARAWTRRHLARSYGDVPDVLEKAELVVSELVTNAVQAGSDTVDVLLELHQTRSVIRVRDYAPGRPVRVQSPHINDIGGRGLTIVDAVSGDWGTDPHSTGKTVWATLPVPASSRPQFRCSDEG